MTIIQILVLIFFLSILALIIYATNSLFKKYYKQIGLILVSLFLIGVVFRIIIPIFNNNGIIIPVNEIQQKNWFLSIPLWEKYYHSIWFSLLLVFGYFYKSNKCSLCKSFDFKEINKQLKDEYTEQKQLTSTGSEGNINYKKYYTQKVRTKIYEITCQCNICNNIWKNIIKNKEYGDKIFTHKEYTKIS